MKIKYDLQILGASKAYAKTLFRVAEKHTAQAQDYHNSETGAEDRGLRRRPGLGVPRGRQGRRPGVQGGRPDQDRPHRRVRRRGLDVPQPRRQALERARSPNVENGKCVGANGHPGPDRNAYHDPYYDKNGLNLDRMPQGLNKGSSFFFFDTFTPDYAANYFRPNAYHTWGTDKVINGDDRAQAGRAGRLLAHHRPGHRGLGRRRLRPHLGRPLPLPLRRPRRGAQQLRVRDLAQRQAADVERLPARRPADLAVRRRPALAAGRRRAAPTARLDYTGGTALPPDAAPRPRRVYGLFFRSTPGYLYRPIPRGDVYWLAVSNWTDFYSRPQWVNGQLTNAPWYGTWWTNTKQALQDRQGPADASRTTSCAGSPRRRPYARWVGRIRAKSSRSTTRPTTGRPARSSTPSPKYEDLPAPDYHVHADGGQTGDRARAALSATEQHVHTDYGVDLTDVSNAVEKAKAHGVLGLGYDDSVNHEQFRDFIDANRAGIADEVDGVNTIPSINMVFEKAYTWALPAIVGGIAVGTEDGEAWGVMNNVNDRVKCVLESHYPPPAGDRPGEKPLAAGAVPAHPGDRAAASSYTIEHEAAHNLGLSHPHDGSYGVDKCPSGHANAGEWKCYWNGLGWMYDISAAPTTYAMSYRPYEVEDQDNLQRGHVAEYLDHRPGRAASPG